MKYFKQAKTLKLTEHTICETKISMQTGVHNHFAKVIASLTPLICYKQHISCLQKDSKVSIV